MPSILEAAKDAFRDYEIAGVPASGAYDPQKSQVRGVFALIDLALSSLGVSGAITVKKSTLANLNAELGHPADTLAIVYDDPDPANNGYWVKQGASGSGSWDQSPLAVPSTLAGNLLTALTRSNELVALAADLSGEELIYDTKAAATADLSDIPDDGLIYVLQDETQTGARTAYRKEAGALSFKSNLGFGGLVFLPNQTAMRASMAYGDGLRQVTSGGGQQGQDNIAVGIGAGLNLTTGYNNVLIGTNTGKALGAHTTFTSYGAASGNVGNVFVGPNIASAADGALDNTGMGVNVFQNLSKGMDNAAFGINALQQVAEGSENAAFGHATLQYLVGSSTWEDGNGHRNSAFGDMAGRFLNGYGANKTGGKAGTFVGTRTTSLSNDTTNENVFGSFANGFGSNSVSLGSPEVEQQRHQGFITVGKGAQELEPAAPIHAYNLVTGGVGHDGLRATRAGAPGVYAFVEVLAGTNVGVLGANASGERGQLWFRISDADDDELFPLKLDEDGQVYLPELTAAAATPNLSIDGATGKLTEATGAVTIYVPTITAGTGAFGSAPTVQNATWSYTSPKRAAQQLDFTIPDAGTATDSLIIDLPVNAARNANAVAYDANGVAYGAVIRNVGGGIYKLIILTFAGATAIATGRSYSVSIEWDTV